MKTFSLNNLELLEYQPNRPPFLMIDHVTKVMPGKFAEGYKKLFKTEWYFPIHFPGNPNMPGALQLEALAQMLTVAITTLPGNKGKITHAISHQVKFKKEVNSPQRYMTEYRYSDEQVKGKLRQLYHNTDTLKENRYAYINETTWGNAKRNISRW